MKLSNAMVVLIIELLMETCRCEPLLESLLLSRAQYVEVVGSLLFLPYWNGSRDVLVACVPGANRDVFFLIHQNDPSCPSRTVPTFRCSGLSCEPVQSNNCVDVAHPRTSIEVSGVVRTVDVCMDDGSKYTSLHSRDYPCRYDPHCPFFLPFCVRGSCVTYSWRSKTPPGAQQQLTSTILPWCTPMRLIRRVVFLVMIGIVAIKLKLAYCHSSSLFA